MLKIAAVVPLTAYFAFARIEMANASYDDPKVAEHATLNFAGGGGQIVTASMSGPEGPQLVAQWWPVSVSVSLSGTGSKTKTGTGSKSKNGGSKSGTGSQSQNHSGSKSGTGSQSKNASNSGTGSKSKQGSQSASGTQSKTSTGTQSQSKHADPPLIPILGI